MNGGVKSLLLAAGFAAAGCASAPTEIRPIADPGAKLRRGADGLADARGQLAIGNVGLALEGFRKVAREYPDNAEALAGMAACYEAMGRFDVAETKYQAALALSPRDPVLLTALAAVLDRLGRTAQAAGVRSEVAQLRSAAAVLESAAADDDPQPAPSATMRSAPSPLPPAASVTVALPKPQLAASEVVTLPSAARAERLDSTAKLAATALPLLRADTLPPAEQVTVKLPPPRLADPARVYVATAPLAVRETALNRQASVGVDTSPDIPAARIADQASVSVKSAPLAVRAAGLDRQAAVMVDLSTEVPAAQLGRHAPVDVAAPRLERMSLGEVALLTAGGPVWRAQVVERTPQKLSVRWVPLATAAATRPNIRILNAARWQGLAAHNRSYLLNRGWRKIEIGDAPRIRERSLVLYPARYPTMGRRLAAQFGFRAQPIVGANEFLVLLGRDAPLRPAKLRG